jgi:prolipoprotein diacylglyceryltransferase
MYPNLYYIVKDWFGAEIQALSIINTFGLLVAAAFAVAAWILNLELKRKEKAGLLFPREEIVVVGMPASVSEILTNGFLGFIFGFKLVGLIFDRASGVNPQDYIFSSEGSWMGGLAFGGLMAYLKWHDKNKEKRPAPEKRTIRIWPHDRVGDIIVLGLIFGILGAKLFDNLEHWDEFWADPIGRLLSPSGLTFYGGLILAALSICIFAYRKNITIKHLCDAAAPALMIAYAVGRLGCQISGDGDWGIYNSAYKNDVYGKVTTANPEEFAEITQKNSTYFLEGYTLENNKKTYVTDRVYPDLQSIPHKSIKAPSFLPIWLFAYPYAQNVNKDGIVIPGILDEHNRVLPAPVFPTPLYETIMCLLLFILLWTFRKKIKAPWLMFGLYLVLNGAERFFIEKLRVNIRYETSGLNLTQAEGIALGLILCGLALSIFAILSAQKQKINS